MTASERSRPKQQPLAISDDGTPIVYEVLGAYFHLEALREDDGERLKEACDAVLEWYGDSLRTTENSAYGIAEPFRRSDMEYVASYAEGLEVSSELGEAHAMQEARGLRGSRNQYGFVVHGGERADDASPYTFRFYSEIPALKAPRLEPRCMIRLTVPTSWPFEDFRQRVVDIASKLRLRWASAGYTYSGIEDFFPEEYWKAVSGHCYRYPGSDVGAYSPFMLQLYDKIRSVNWLTFLGAALTTEVTIPPAHGLVQISKSEHGTLLTAGGEPQRGDLNRLIVPPAYVDADAIVRAVRLASGIEFMDPFDETSTARWLRRFELRLN